jgi:hypothetical protein
MRISIRGVKTTDSMLKLKPTGYMNYATTETAETFYRQLCRPSRTPGGDASVEMNLIEYLIEYLIDYSLLQTETSADVREPSDTRSAEKVFFASI